jgi:hypothetical protein
MIPAAAYAIQSSPHVPDKLTLSLLQHFGGKLDDVTVILAHVVASSDSP